MPSSTLTTPAFRYFKLPNKDRYVPAQILRISETGHAMFIIVEAHIATVCASLLGDAVHYLNLGNTPYLGSWISISHKAQWRTSLETVPIGKSVDFKGRALAAEEIPVDLELPEAPDVFDIETFDDNEPREVSSYSSKYPGNLENVTPRFTETPAISQSHQDVTSGALVTTSGVHFEKPLFVVLPNNQSPVDGKVIHHARTATNSVAVPNGKVFTGIDDLRPISDILKATNEAAAYNAWTAIEYYFYLLKILGDNVRRKIAPQPQATAAAYGIEVHRLCSLLHHHYSSETELVQALYRWNSLVMGDKQLLSDYLKLFEEVRQQVERLQGAPIDERILKHKLLMTLPTVHREAGLNKMSSLGYHELLHEEYEYTYE